MKVFWFDCETSGINPIDNGIIQLAYIVEIDGVEMETGQLFSNCKGKKIERSALNINGFTEKEIKTFPDPKEMYKALKNIFKNHVNEIDKFDKFVVGGYNIDFDRKFLMQLFLNYEDKTFGSWFAYGNIDPSQIIRFLEYCGKPFMAKAKLVNIASYYGISVKNAHDAVADIRMTIEVVRAIQREVLALSVSGIFTASPDKKKLLDIAGFINSKIESLALNSSDKALIAANKLIIEAAEKL